MLRSKSCGCRLWVLVVQKHFGTSDEGWPLRPLGLGPGILVIWRFSRLRAILGMALPF
jgi:hypothetical protein